ncbi:Coiled-coil domain-containing protein 148 [Liparis tanakae]|uniref:Coiled-coil domain-containing protein 148 n=1 Tax=Liparis tanakae TaxID=230148 RepID=A0A4Z2J2E3_9TELE|nr:Coiled-coil domain-containing protein 148 [Liparis tanakae]
MEEELFCVGCQERWVTSGGAEEPFGSDVLTLCVGCAPSRVLFRADMLQRRREEREAQELEWQREEEEKHNRLEVLRNQVRVVAEADPERMMADTAAWKGRHVTVEEFELRRPLYSINTYTDTQIVSDPRVRVERALRDAGLQHSQYAKEVLSIVTPFDALKHIVSDIEEPQQAA